MEYGAQLDDSMSWTKAEIEKLKELAGTRKYFYSEIAQILKKGPNLVRHQARRLGLPKSTRKMGEWNSKHAHLREAVMKYFVTHSWEDTRKHFGLKSRELKSLFTVAYRDPNLAHLRKDKRRHDGWTLEEKLFLIRHSGIIPRKEISRRLKRGGFHSIKEELSRLNSNSKFMNGIPLSWYIDIFDRLPDYSIKTKAGPTGGKRGNFHFKLVPWVECERQLGKTRVNPVYRDAIRAMARFQRWIHQTDCDAAIKRRLRMGVRDV